MRYRINLPCLPSETAQCKAVTLELSYIRIWKQLSQVIPWSLPFPANNAQCSFPSTTSATCWLTRSFPQSTCVSTSSTSWGYPITCSLHGCPPPKLLTWCRGLYPYPAPLAPTYYPYGNLKHLSTFGQITSLLCFKFFNDCWLYSEWNQFCNMASKVLYDLTPPPHSSKCIPPSLSSLSFSHSLLPSALAAFLSSLFLSKSLSTCPCCMALFSCISHSKSPPWESGEVFNNH